MIPDRSISGGTALSNSKLSAMTAGQANIGLQRAAAGLSKSRKVSPEQLKGLAKGVKTNLVRPGHPGKAASLFDVLAQKRADDNLQEFGSLMRSATYDVHNKVKKPKGRVGTAGPISSLKKEPTPVDVRSYSNTENKDVLHRWLAKKKGPRKIVLTYGGPLTMKKASMRKAAAKLNVKRFMKFSPTKQSRVMMNLVNRADYAAAGGWPMSHYLSRAGVTSRRPIKFETAQKAQKAVLGLTPAYVKNLKAVSRGMRAGG